MKITKTTASLLAGRVLENLLKTVDFVPEEQIKEITKFVKARAILLAVLETHRKKLNEFDKRLYRMPGCVNARGGYDLESILREVRRSQIPSKETITNEIMLSGMFSKEEDLEKFITSITAKFLPKDKRRRK